VGIAATNSRGKRCTSGTFQVPEEQEIQTDTLEPGERSGKRSLFRLAPIDATLQQTTVQGREWIDVSDFQGNSVSRNKS
jgi:hypothetical protein